MSPTMRMVVALIAAGGSLATVSSAREQWLHWSGKWTGDQWTAGNLDNSIFYTCVAVDVSFGSQEYWGSGYGNAAARHAYNQILEWGNNATRNPASIEVHCGY